ncbi:aspartyl-phosphate phosphatase Spo0E family protein [Halobacillus massiliensis]|uniref:aspartyl-phosphate phosphatase Spo0E family protein n=1 Tax=Halobacillus massiliensis TaxID=1926286 RepID=UPI0009E2758C|nr:aspartyl-phosphate phosphatase Spo0E family protein [Halobacillus massiliensis]
MKRINAITYKQSLLQEIEYRRKRLLILGGKLGLTHKETLETSQILDELINEYIRKGK